MLPRLTPIPLTPLSRLLPPDEYAELTRRTWGRISFKHRALLTCLYFRGRRAIHRNTVAPTPRQKFWAHLLVTRYVVLWTFYEFREFCLLAGSFETAVSPEDRLKIGVVLATGARCIAPKDVRRIMKAAKAVDKP